MFVVYAVIMAVKKIQEKLGFPKVDQEDIEDQEKKEKEVENLMRTTWNPREENTILNLFDYFL